MDHAFNFKNAIDSRAHPKILEQLHSNVRSRESAMGQGWQLSSAARTMDRPHSQRRQPHDLSWEGSNSLR